MLEARKVGLWRNRYEIVADGQPLAMWDGRVWRSGGTFDLAGRNPARVRRLDLRW